MHISVLSKKVCPKCLAISLCETLLIYAKDAIYQLDTAYALDFGEGSFTLTIHQNATLLI